MNMLKRMGSALRREGFGSSWRTPEGLMTALGMVWLAVFPFLQGGTYSSITRAKWEIMLALTGLSAACAAAAVLWRREKGGKIRLTWLHAAGLTYFALVGLSAVFGAWADHTGESGRLTVLWGAYRYEGLITQMCYGLVFLSMSLIRVRVRPLVTAASLGLLGYCAVVGLQYAGVNVWGLFPAGTSILTNYEFQGPIGNIDMVVGYVSIVMAAALGGFAGLKKACWLWFAAGLAGVLLTLCMEVQCGLVMLAGLLFLLLLLAMKEPQARWRAAVILAGVLAMLTARLLLAFPWLDGVDAVCLRMDAWRFIPLAAGMMVIIPAVLLRKHPGRGLRLRTVMLAAAGLVLLAVAAVYLLPIPAGNGLWELQQILHGRAQDSFGSERIGVWRLTLEICRDNLLWGTGPDVFLHAMDHHLWQTGQSLVQRFDNPHNLFLGVLVNSGLPALGLYVTLTLGASAAAAARLRRDGEVLPLMMAVVCYLLQGMFTFSICLVTPMFWAALGMLAGQMSDRKREGMCIPQGFAFRQMPMNERKEQR